MAHNLGTALSGLSKPGSKKPGTAKDAKVLAASLPKIGTKKRVN